MLCNTVPPVLPEFVAPAFQLGHDGLNPSDLLDGLRFDARGCVVAASRFRRLHRVEGRVIVYALFELLQHFNGSADLGCGWSSHDQTWMPCECLRVGDCSWRRFRGGSHCAFRACSAVTGCAQGSPKPSRIAASSAAIFVGASTTVRNGSPISRAYSRSVKKMPQSWLPWLGVTVVLMVVVEHTASWRWCISYTRCADSPNNVRGVALLIASTRINSRYEELSLANAAALQIPASR